MLSALSRSQGTAERMVYSQLPSVAGAVIGWDRHFATKAAEALMVWRRPSLTGEYGRFLLGYLPTQVGPVAVGGYWLWRRSSTEN